MLVSLALMRMVPDGPEHPSVKIMRTNKAYIDSLAVPVEIVWGIKDPVLEKSFVGVRATFPRAFVTEAEAGHFLQEEVPDVIAAAIERVYARSIADSKIRTKL